TTTARNVAIPDTHVPRSPNQSQKLTTGIPFFQTPGAVRRCYECRTIVNDVPVRMQEVLRATVEVNPPKLIGIARQGPGNQLARGKDDRVKDLTIVRGRDSLDAKGVTRHTTPVGRRCVAQGFLFIVRVLNTVDE